MNARLDVLTVRGQQSVRDERRAVELFHEKFPRHAYWTTPKDAPWDHDGEVYLRGALRGERGRLCAIAETKCRDMTRVQLVNWYSSRWLITMDKLDRCREIAVERQVPLIGLLYLIPDDDLIVQRFYEADGSPATDIRSRPTRTQKTINGGQIVRNNAFVLVKNVQQ